MACPTFDAFLTPFLEVIADNKEWHWRDVMSAAADTMKLSEADRTELIASGNRTRLQDRVHWAKTYLKQAGLIEQPSRGIVRLTDRGRNAIKTKAQVNLDYLRQFPEFKEFQVRSKPTTPEAQGGTADPEVKTPQELIEEGFKKLRGALVSELVEQLKKVPPSFFEKIVVDLMLALGYGGSAQDAGLAVGKSGDGGIDGMIKEDKLGLDIIYLQAKRWEHPVPAAVVREFGGSLLGKRARKGVLITTSTFSEGSRDYVRSLDQRISLIDGVQLAELMIDHNLGIVEIESYPVKRIDADYFAED